MKIEKIPLTIRQLAQDYFDNAENGVVGFGGKLDIRPPFQREFVYDNEQRTAVINSVMENFPLNAMYWADRGNGTFEIIDGQQRTLSLCQFVHGDFSFKNRYFSNMTKDEQEKFLDYALMVYVCAGTDSEKLAWFQVINIKGAVLTDQELRNAVYAGTWVSDAKRYFSKTNCPAYRLAKNYVSGSPIRQEVLETAIEWISSGKIENYMATHQHEPNANELWLHFQSVIAWVKATFPKSRSEMKHVGWGTLFSKFGKEKWDASALETRVKRLMEDSDVQKKPGIYAYVLDGDERHLNIRAFDANTKREVYEKQNGLCAHCGESFSIEQMEADHITPWSQGGRTIAENCRMLCRKCNRQNGAK